MIRNRGRALVLSTHVLSALLLVSGDRSLARAADCAGIPAWSATTTYASGALVTYGGSLYKALVSTTNVPPNYCAACGWWQLQGACGTTPTCSQSPAVPTGLGAANITSSGASLSWSPVSAPTGCSVSYRVYQNGTQIAAPSTASAVVTGLSPATSYSFTVVSVDAAGASAPSAALAVKTPAQGCTTAPSVPTALKSSNLTGTCVTLSWTAASAATGCSVTYTVYRNGVAVQTGLTNPSATVCSLAPGTSYTFSVAASDAAGTSPTSTSINVTTPSATCAAAPSVPSGLNSPSQTNGSVSLGWNPSSAGSNCSITYDIYQDGKKVLSVPTSTAVLSGLKAGTSYSFAVSAVDQAGASALSSTLSAKTQNATAPVSITFTRKNAYSGGYGGQIDVANLGSAAFTNWTLSFSSTDTLSLYNGNLSQSGSTCTITPASWSPTLAGGATWTSGFGGVAPGMDWNPPATAIFNGVTVPVSIVDNAVNAGGAVVATFPDYEAINKPANQITLGQGTTQVRLAWMGDTKGPITVATNHPELIQVSMSSDGKTMVVVSKQGAGGRAAVRLTDTSTGKARYVGLRVKNAAGEVPVFPPYVSVGVCSEDTDGDLKMFQDFGEGDKNRRADNRYVYLNGGPVNGWYNWTTNPGDRARTYIRNSQKLGMIPTFVWYNIPDGGESYTTDLQHIQDASYMQGYFDLLAKTLTIFNAESPSETLMLVMEPDFIGYMMQNSGLQPSQISAQVMAPAQAAGMLKAGDPSFPNTLEGLVKAINHIIKRDCPQAKLGWQINVWSSPDNVPGGNLIKTTDAQGWTAGRTFIQTQAQKVAAYYAAAGITYKADFISFDKYGYDAGGADRSPADPSKGNWFWNSDHWSNYLLYVKGLHTATNLPVALWQLPVGRINTTLAANPYSGSGTFADLTNTNNSYEDSCATYFFGDRFNPGSSLRQTYFAKNQAQDPALATSGSTLAWGAHFQSAKDAGVFNLMFGDGVGDSTRARPAGGTTPTDGWWLMTALQRYLANPVPNE